MLGGQQVIAQFGVWHFHLVSQLLALMKNFLWPGLTQTFKNSNNFVCYSSYGLCTIYSEEMRLLEMFIGETEWLNSDFGAFKHLIEVDYFKSLIAILVYCSYHCQIIDWSLLNTNDSFYLEAFIQWISCVGIYIPSHTVHIWLNTVKHDSNAVKHDAYWLECLPFFLLRRLVSLNILPARFICHIECNFLLVLCSMSNIECIWPCQVTIDISGSRCWHSYCSLVFPPQKAIGFVFWDLYVPVAKADVVR